MNENEKCFEEVSEDFYKPLVTEANQAPEPVTFQVGEVMDIKGRDMRIVRITKHCIVLTPLGWEVDIGEDIQTIKERERKRHTSGRR